jgi:uncharacterized protein YigA (DUF484 family)
MAGKDDAGADDRPGRDRLRRRDRTVSSSATGVQGITEADIANYLANTPGFFERHAELLSSVQLTSPHGQRAVSLQERQMEMLRERIKGLELKIVEMIRHGQENVAIADRLHRWTRALLSPPSRRPARRVAVDELQHEFLIPQAAIRLWGCRRGHAGAPSPRPSATTRAASPQPGAALLRRERRLRGGALAGRPGHGACRWR